MEEWGAPCCVCGSSPLVNRRPLGLRARQRREERVALPSYLHRRTSACLKGEEKSFGGAVAVLRSSPNSRFGFRIEIGRTERSGGPCAVSTSRPERPRAGGRGSEGDASSFFRPRYRSRAWLGAERDQGRGCGDLTRLPVQKEALLVGEEGNPGGGAFPRRQRQTSAHSGVAAAGLMITAALALSMAADQHRGRWERVRKGKWWVCACDRSQKSAFLNEEGIEEEKGSVLALPREQRTTNWMGRRSQKGGDGPYPVAFTATQAPAVRCQGAEHRGKNTVRQGSIAAGGGG